MTTLVNDKQIERDNAMLDLLTQRLKDDGVVEGIVHTLSDLADVCEAIADEIHNADSKHVRDLANGLNNAVLAIFQKQK